MLSKWVCRSCPCICSYVPVSGKLNRARSHSKLLHLHGPVTVPHDPRVGSVAGAGTGLLLASDPIGAGGVGAVHEETPLSNLPCSLQYQCSFQSFQRIGCLQCGHLSFNGSFAFVTIVCPSISNLYSCFCIIFQPSVTECSRADSNCRRQIQNLASLTAGLRELNIMCRDLFPADQLFSRGVWSNRCVHGVVVCCGFHHLLDFA